MSNIDSHLEYLNSEWWRLNNLYYIVNKSGHQSVFKLNWAQQQLHEDAWYCNIILKARQLGISTYVCLLFLDKCLWNKNISAGIIADTRENAEQIFKRIKFAYDTLPISIRNQIVATSDSARELAFSNGSRIVVGTSMRGSTLQYLHISEFGKICAKYPEKAKEILTGSLNTIAPGQYVFIESTAEGKEGYFYDMCQQAQKQTHPDREISKIDFKFHFFPWWKEPGYRIGSPINVPQAMHDYFLALFTQGIKLDNEQKWWYSVRASTQFDNMKREYPSTPDEAWEQSIDGSYYGSLIRQARLEQRICHVPYDDQLLVNTAWDLGYNDSTAIWFFQVYGKEVRLIDYVEGSGESLASWLNLVKQKKYTYDRHLAPHDITSHEYTSGLTRQTTARKLGFNLIPVPKGEVIAGIDAVRGLLNRCWFDEKKCEKGIKALENYKKEWDERHGCWSRKPLHNEHSHGSDAFRYLASGLHFITGRRTPEEIERSKLESLKDYSGCLPGSMFYEGPADPKRRSQF